MEFKFRIKRWCPNFKGKSLNFNTFLNHKQYSIKDLEYLAYQNYLTIYKIENKKTIQSNILEYKEFILKKAGKTKEENFQKQIDDVEKLVKPKKKKRNK